MTKRERLDRLMRAAEKLQYQGMYPLRTGIHSCFVTARFCECGDEYAEFVGVDAFDPAFREYSEQTQLTRQLAVLMYREAVKRGEA